MFCAGGGLEAPVAEKHATVLGLSAFVLASPYDVPEWLPELLLALVRAASQPAPIKTSVRCALLPRVPGPFSRACLPYAFFHEPTFHIALSCGPVMPYRVHSFSHVDMA